MHHSYYVRNTDASRISTTVALLCGTALKAYVQQCKDLGGAPTTYADLIDRLGKTWRLVLPFYALHNELTALVKRGPAMQTEAGNLIDCRLSRETCRKTNFLELFNYYLFISSS